MRIKPISLGSEHQVTQVTTTKGKKNIRNESPMVKETNDLSKEKMSLLGKCLKAKVPSLRDRVTKA